MMETINVDLLFEKNTFENIEQIKSNLYENADKKKDELRQIIGQSYRELISISNVVEKMLVSCDNLAKDIGQLKYFCDQSKFSPKNKVNHHQTSQHKDDDNQINEFNLTRVRLKIIIKSPNQILDALSEDDVLRAAVLYRTKYLCNQFTDEEKRSFNTLNHHNIFLEKIYGLIYQKYIDITNYKNYALNDGQLFRTLFAICLIKAESIDQVILEFMKHRQEQCIDLFRNQQDDTSSTLLVFFQIIFNTLEIVFNLYNSAQILQIYFDLLFVKSLLHHSVKDEQLKIELQNVLNQFQQYIDPFDLHLFSSYIPKNIEQNKSSLRMILNYLLPQNLHIASTDHSFANARERNFKIKFNLL